MLLGYSVTIEISILILDLTRTGFSRITSAYVVKFTLEWYTCDKRQKANLFVGLGVSPLHLEIGTRIAIAHKQNDLWP